MSVDASLVAKRATVTDRRYTLWPPEPECEICRLGADKKGSLAKELVRNILLRRGG
jgi:hypothetical protein